MPSQIMQFSEIEQLLIYLAGLGGTVRVRFRENSTRSRGRRGSETDDEYDERRRFDDGQQSVQFVGDFFRRQAEFEGEVVSVTWKDANGNRLKIYCRYFEVSVRTERLQFVETVHRILRDQPNIYSLTATILM
jgi:hypothetical protein